MATNWRALAESSIRQREIGYAFPLPKTFPDHPARVREIPLAELASATGLSSEMQETVLEVFREIQSGGTFAVRSWQDLGRNQKRQRDLANGLCIAGFIEPRLTETQAESDESDDPAVLWVERIHINDRLSYMQAVMNAESEAAKALTPFPEAGSGRVDAGEALPAAPTPIHGAGDGSGGIQPLDAAAI